MRFLPTIKDSRGRESHTLLFVALAALVLIYKFTLAGLTLWGLTFPAMSASEFGIAFAAILAVWLGREWKEKTP
jgi:cytosine/uracil/thiamine/allantoin permease